MAIPGVFSFTRYLEAKKSIDDRALNRHVWQALIDNLPESSCDRPLRILEIGAGVGTMIERLIENDIFSYATYDAIDADRENITHALNRLKEWSRAHEINLSVRPEQRCLLDGAGKRIDVCLRDEDFFSFVAREQESYDLIITNAFLDLVDVPATLPLILDLLDCGGMFYFSINFDGVTAMEPAIDPELDDRILSRYHRSMDERIINGKCSGDSRAGRHLFAHLDACDARILAAGGSDWVVFPGPGGYTGDEAYFLHFIIHTIHEALKGDPALDSGQLDKWVAERHRQVEQGQLVYLAHQLDFIGTSRHSGAKPPETPG